MIQAKLPLVWASDASAAGMVLSAAHSCMQCDALLQSQHWTGAVTSRCCCTVLALRPLAVCNPGRPPIGKAEQPPRWRSCLLFPRTPFINAPMANKQASNACCENQAHLEGLVELEQPRRIIVCRLRLAPHKRCGKSHYNLAEWNP